MLIITRKIGEGVVIGDNIRVTVAEIAKDRVKLGIEAPSDVKIIRNELYFTEKFNVQAATRKLPVSLVAEMLDGKNSSENN